MEGTEHLEGNVAMVMLLGITMSSSVPSVMLYESAQFNPYPQSAFGLVQCSKKAHMKQKNYYSEYSVELPIYQKAPAKKISNNQRRVRIFFD